MNTISKIAKRFNLSRSTLLYYDTVGVLSPKSRSASGYRIYSQKDIEKLEKITVFRKAGIPIDKIKRLLSTKESDSQKILEQHLETLNHEIGNLREQQHFLIRLLQNKNITKRSSIMNKETWVKVLRSTGLTDKEMDDWHRNFEEIAPGAHHDFLKSLGIKRDEIEKIRKQYKK